MKGFIYFLLIVCLSFILAIVFKFIKVTFKNKKESEPVAPKIYYVTKTHKKRQQHGVSVPITVEGAVIEKEKKR